jgi:hypothetical protein
MPSVPTGALGVETLSPPMVTAKPPEMPDTAPVSVMQLAITRTM